MSQVLLFDIPGVTVVLNDSPRLVCLVLLHTWAHGDGHTLALVVLC